MRHLPAAFAALPALAALALAGGCGKKEPVDPESLTAVADAPPEARDVEPAPVPDPRGIPIPPNTRTTFACESGEQVTVAWFVDENYALFARGDQTSRLERLPAETGFRFASGPTEIAGTADSFTLTDGLTATRCVAVSGEAGAAPAPAAAADGKGAANGASAPGPG